ncbi:6-phosphogluconolactonase [Sinosporangium siamense]|uniref:6-phosphogluconolactonase n=1 Tax=Sinosporangium siamense TaxID=1367973 RepID=A0A919RMT4_9ACTN|nr:6-phosphogluconolactonase [Sinosporangium siamense]GII96613.1 6-phosphogluconolactonase [Sinosporangium siamense]
MSVPHVLVHRDPSVLADAVAARLITRLVDAQSAKGHASVVLTGGTIGIAVLASVAATAARDAVDWRRLDVWWGDERFLPAGDSERNETGARKALLDHVDLDPARVHVMRGPDSGMTAEESADSYVSELRAAARPEDHGPVPSFDVMLLGMGPDAHVASLFPGHPALYDERPAVAVHGSPKPPPTRISLTLPSLQAAQEVWVVAAGAEKAGAVRLALSTGAGVVQVPAAGARGRRGTWFLLDRASASELPPDLSRAASP